MSLSGYRELREKVISQMESQVRDVKTIAVEQWAKENGFGNVYFEDYEQALEWIEINVNTKKRTKRLFYEFESEVDDELEYLIEELEEGSTSAMGKVVRNIYGNVISPAMKIALTAVTINLVVTQATGLGMTFAGNKAHEWADNLIEQIDLRGKIDYSGLQEKVTTFFESTEKSVEDFFNDSKPLKLLMLGIGKFEDENVDIDLSNLMDDTNDFIENEEQEMKIKVGAIEDRTKTSLKNATESIHGKYDDWMVPITKKFVSVTLGYFQSKGIIKSAGRKMEVSEMKNENADQTEQIEFLKAEIAELKRKQLEVEHDSPVKQKRKIALENITKPQQMKFIVQQMQEIFSDKDFCIPEIPIDCISMEEYGEFLRKSLQNQNVEASQTSMVYMALDIYKNNIGRMCRDLKMGKTGVIARTRESIGNISRDTQKLVADIGEGSIFALKEGARTVLKDSSKKIFEREHKLEENLEI